jgi:twinkle protein
VTEREDSEPDGPKGTCPCDDPSESFQLYSDGHGHCFAGGCPHPYWSPERLRKAGWDVEGRSEAGGRREQRRPMSEDVAALLETSEVRALQRWNISQATARHWDYRTRLNAKGEGEHLAVYRDDSRQVVDIKVRNTGVSGEDKRFYWASGHAPKGLLYGSHLLPQQGKMVVVAMGEKDAMTISQLWANKFPVVSPSGGEAAAKKDIAANLERLLKFDKIVLVPHADPAGFKAMEEVARVLPPGRAFIARLPLNDANDMHMAARDQELISLIHNAPAHRPDGIVAARDLVGEALNAPQMGLSFGFPEIDKLTYAWLDGQVVVLGAGIGMGKSDFALQVAASLLRGGTRCAVFNYEASPAETLKGIAGKNAERRFHVPDEEGLLWTQAELVEALRQTTEDNASLFINDHFGAVSWDAIKERSRYLAHSEGVKRVFVDPVAALVAQEDDERKALDRVFAEAKMLAEELDIGLWFNSHLTRPSDGKPHEEGGRVMQKHFRGSGAITMWASHVWGLERNQQSEDESERGETVWRILKNRPAGHNTGKTLRFTYNVLSGMLEPSRIELEDAYEADPEAPPL